MTNIQNKYMKILIAFAASFLIGASVYGTNDVLSSDAGYCSDNEYTSTKDDCCSDNQYTIPKYGLDSCENKQDLYKKSRWDSCKRMGKFLAEQIVRLLSLLSPGKIYSGYRDIEMEVSYISEPDNSQFVAL